MVSFNLYIIIVCCAAVFLLIALVLFFKLKDLRRCYDEDIFDAEKRGFKAAMSVKINDSDAYHAGYIKAMRDVHTDKTLIQAELSLIGDTLEERLNGGDKNDGSKLS